MRFKICFATFSFLAALSAISLDAQGVSKADLLKATEKAFYEDQNFDKAIEGYDEYIKKYPSDPVTDSLRVKLGLANLFSGKYQAAVDAMAKLVEGGQPELRDSALFWSGQAQLILASTLKPEDPNFKKTFELALANYTKHIDGFPKSSSREDALYGRALAQFYTDKFEGAEKDLLTLGSNYSQSPISSDYLLTLGNVYSTRYFKLKPEERASVGKELARKALEAFGKVAVSQLNLLAANDAAYRKAELLLSIADEPKDFETALQAFRQVKPRDALVPEQDRVVKASAAAIAEAAKAGRNDKITELRIQQQRENGRLKDLTSKPDQAVLAMIKVAECYVRLKALDEARLVLRRVEPVAETEQRKNIRYLRLLTYAAQRNVAKADEEFTSFQKDFPNDASVSNVSIMIGDALSGQGDFQGAYEAYTKNLKDFPQGPQAGLAAMKQAAMLVSLKKPEEASRALQDYISKNADSPNIFEAQKALADALIQQGKTDEAIKSFRDIAANPKSGAYQPVAALQVGMTLYQVSRWDEAIKAFEEFATKYPQHELVPRALYMSGVAHDKKGDVPGGIAAMETVVSKYPKDPLAINAQIVIANAYAKQKKFPEMLAAYEKLISTFPGSDKVPLAYSKIAEFYDRGNDFANAEKTYLRIIGLNEANFSAPAFVNLADMWLRAANQLTRNYSALDEAGKKQWQHHVAQAEEQSLACLQKYPEQAASGAALENLVEIFRMRTKAGLVKTDESVKYFDGLAGKFTDPTMAARLKLTQVSLIFAEGDYVHTLKTFKEVLEANPNVTLSAGDLSRYGTALLENNQPEEAAAQFQKLIQNFPYEPRSRANEAAFIDGQHGLGLIALRKGEAAQAAPYFEALKKQYPFYAVVLKAGHTPQAPKILEAEYGLGVALETANKGEEARKSFLAVMSSDAHQNADLQADKTKIFKVKALSSFAYARTLEKEGKLVPKGSGNEPNAASNYTAIHDFYGGVDPDLAAEGLWKGGQLFQKGGLNKNARQAYKDLVDNYPKSSLAAKAQEAMKGLPAGN